MIFDSDTFYSTMSPELRPKLCQAPEGVPKSISYCVCLVCLKNKIGVSKRKRSIFNDFDMIYPEKTNELTTHQYLICSGSKGAYVLEARCWCK